MPDETKQAWSALPPGQKAGVVVLAALTLAVVVPLVAIAAWWIVRGIGWLLAVTF